MKGDRYVDTWFFLDWAWHVSHCFFVDGLLFSCPRVSRDLIAGTIVGVPWRTDKMYILSFSPMFVFSQVLVPGTCFTTRRPFYWMRLFVLANAPVHFDESLSMFVERTCPLYWMRLGVFIECASPFGRMRLSILSNALAHFGACACSLFLQFWIEQDLIYR